MVKEENFIDKQTSVKTLERIKFHAKPFAGGYKVELTWAFNPDDSTQLDQILEYESSDVRKALEAFKKNVIEGTLKGKLIED